MARGVQPSKGGNKTLEEHGRSHFVRLAHMRHGRLGGPMAKD